MKGKRFVYNSGGCGGEGGAGGMSGDVLVEPRSACPIIRTHQRFLLRSLEFTQQYASMYRCRMEKQYEAALRAIQHTVRRERGIQPTENTAENSLDPLRVLELRPGVPAICVGVLYKNMKLLPRFLDEYQRELVRVDAGDENDEEGGGVAAVEEGAAAIGVQGTAGIGENEEDAEPRLETIDEHYSICDDADEVMIEDNSGRVIIQGLRADRFCTGLVVGIYGTLQPNGSIAVHHYAMSGDVERQYVPRPMREIRGYDGGSSPCYLAFVCGLNVDVPRGPDPEERAAATRARASLELLMDFFCGNVDSPGLLNKARCVTRVVIGGDSIAPTDELKLKRKVKLDPSDHVRLNDAGKLAAGVVTSTVLMRELDGLLQRLASSVEIELMPGENDMSDAFHPQHPLHPVLLPKAARHSTMRLVSNPFCFTAQPLLVEASAEMEAERKKTKLEEGNRSSQNNSGDKVHFFVTSGQNVNDVARETRFPSRLDTMEMIVGSGCACPTAPNTLFSYPFCKEDPFLFQPIPHCVVACGQPCFETRYVTLPKLNENTHSYCVDSSAKAEEVSSVLVEASDASVVPGVRLVCVPSFSRTGAVVLVDVNSPTLETLLLDFSVMQQN